MKDKQQWPPEPWKMGDRYLQDANGVEIVIYPVRERIIACINACAGVEGLTPGAVGEMVEEIEEIGNDLADIAKRHGWGAAEVRAWELQALAKKLKLVDEVET